MKMHDLILKAIAEQRRIALYYHPGMRLIEPCAYGESSEGNRLLRAFQNSGASASGEHIDWKLFRTDKILRIELLEERFPGIRSEYRRNDKAMRRRIFGQL
jgi:predicted DNA-binding transcriptional regulator YafY